MRQVLRGIVVRGFRVGDSVELRFAGHLQGRARKPGPGPRGVDCGAGKQLADAKQQVQDIAVKAIEGASGARALSHINQIAMEQAKNRPQS